MRMLALGQAWIRRGGEAALITLELPPFLRDLFCESEIGIFQPLGSRTLQQGAAEIVELARKFGIDTVVLDGYSFDLDFQKTIKQSGKTLMVVDDWGHLDRYDADLILNQNLASYEINYGRLAPGAKVLAGPEFVLLRHEFTDGHLEEGTHPSQKPVAQNVLITLGGADFDDLVLRILDALDSMPDLQLKVRVIAGGIDLLREEPRWGANPNLTILHQVRDMAEQYRWADVAICAGGSTNWEMCRFGLPRAVIVLSQNQEANARALSKRGIAIHLGDAQNLSHDPLVQSLRRWLTDCELRQSQSDRAGKLIDGQGANRVVDALLNCR